MWPPAALLFVVVAIKPASAKRETAMITSVMRTSMSVKPFEFVRSAKLHLLIWVNKGLAKGIPMGPELKRWRG